MDLTLNYNGYSITETFPMDSLKLQDLADRLKTFQENPMVQFRFSEYDVGTPYVLCDKTYTADLYQINLFAERLKYLDYMQESQFVALMRANPEAEFEDVLLMTFALDDVQVFSCKNSRELMKTAFENDFLPEFRGCSGEILELLDPEKVAEKVYSQRGGTCYKGYYCEPAEYVRPDINIKIDRLKPEIFRILVAPTKEKNVPDYRFARWISLPCADKNLKSADMQSCEYQSLLPMLSACQFQIEKIHELNQLAQMISELNRHDLV